MSSSTPQHTTTRRAARTLAAVAALGLGVTLCAPAAGAATGHDTRRPAPNVAARVDVDGDGRRDTVTLTPIRADGDPAVKVSVTTARRATSSLVVGTPWLYGNPAWHGAADLDGARGAELVLHSGFGAHTQFWRVLTWRDGRLVSESDPSSGDDTWITDGALSISKGYRVEEHHGRRTLVASTYERNGWGRRATMSGTVTTFTWRRGDWRETSTTTSTVRANAKVVNAAYGWNVPGLPRD